ncbi:MAG: HAD-IA family hydrolase [Betaproteobacteria bacterium]|nr:HAD-IA family hydrolase [Betaproteobacteria bacterium]
MLQALIWDVDGTLVESERDGHLVAFNRAFEALALPWRWSEAHYGALLRITGGRERLLADLAQRDDAPALASEREALARELHRRKNAIYAELVRDGAVPLRAGVRELLEEAMVAGVKLAIATTTSRINVEALLKRHFDTPDAARGAGRIRFDAVVCGEDVATKKPDPEVYRRALAALRLGPLDTLALEDSPGGVAAARGAEVPVLVTRSAYFAHDTVEGAVAIGPGLDDRQGWTPPVRPPGEGRVTLADLRHWHACMEHVSQFG